MQPYRFTQADVDFALKLDRATGQARMFADDDVFVDDPDVDGTPTTGPTLYVGPYRIDAYMGRVPTLAGWREVPRFMVCRTVAKLGLYHEPEEASELVVDELVSVTEALVEVYAEVERRYIQACADLLIARVEREAREAA